MNLPALNGSTALTPLFKADGEVDWREGELLADGVYLGMPEHIYFAQRRLGSTDLKDLFKTPVNWWRRSPHNPHFKGKKWVFGNDRDFGHGFHYLLLEGEEVYLQKCVICPFDGFTTKDAKQWRDLQHLDKKVILSEEMDRNIRYMVMLVQNHPQLKDAMAEGLSELSVFWTDEQGHRFRARFDKLLPSFVLDPKSFGGHNRGRDDQDRALRIIAELSYDVQRFLYDMAREYMVEFIKEGQVYGGTQAQREWLGRFPGADAARLAERMEFYPNGHPDQQSAWSWSWLFMQKPDDAKGHGAILLPIERPRFDLTWRTGKLKCERALENHDYFVRRFGLGSTPNEDGLPAVPWASINPMWRPLDEDFPPWLGDVNAAMSSTEEEGDSE